MAKPQRRPGEPRDRRSMLLGSGVLAALIAMFAWFKRAAIKDDLHQPREDRNQADEAARPQHQPDTISFSGVVMTGGALVALIALVLLGAGGLFALFVDNPGQPANVSPLAETAQVPPEPRSQPDLRPNLQHLRATEDATLSTYGWVDRPNNIVRIPIDRAMDLLVQTGVPVGGTPVPQSQATPVLQPTIQK